VELMDAISGDQCNPRPVGGTPLSPDLVRASPAVFDHIHMRKLESLPYNKTAFPTPGWRNWQTQRTQNPPTFGSWGFDSPSRHQ
jgi:hypothetical protein